VLCFRRQYLIAGAHSEDPKALLGSAKLMPLRRRISCVFLCIFLLLQRGMRGYLLQLSSQLRRVWSRLHRRFFFSWAMLP
jgi:hypothetical protein